MLAIKSALLAVASYALMAEAKAVGNFFKSIVKREPAIRGTKDLWTRDDASSEIAQAFPQCEAALNALSAAQRPPYSQAAGEVTFVKVPQPCTDEVAALNGKQIEGTTFDNQDANIVVSHADPNVLNVFASLFGAQ